MKKENMELENIYCYVDELGVRIHEISNKTVGINESYGVANNLLHKYLKKVKNPTLRGFRRFANTNYVKEINKLLKR